MGMTINCFAVDFNAPKKMFCIETNAMSITEMPSVGDTVFVYETSRETMPKTLPGFYGMGRGELAVVDKIVPFKHHTEPEGFIFYLKD